MNTSWHPLYYFRQNATNMTYRFDKNGKRILKDEIKDRLVAEAARGTTATNSQSSLQSGLQTAATAQRTTGTSHLVQNKNGNLANQKVGRTAQDADLSKPLRHIGMAIAAVVAITIMMSVISLVCTKINELRVTNGHHAKYVRAIEKAKGKLKTAAVPLGKLGHWSKAEVLKNLYGACQKAHAARNYSAENTILKNLSESQPAETKAMLEKLVAANGKNLQYQWQLAAVLYHSGNLAQAKVINDKLLQQIKGSHQQLELQGLAYTLEGRMKARSGRDQEAIQDLTTAVSLFEKAKLPDSVFIDTLRNIAWLELRTGRRMQAAVLFERVNACTAQGEDTTDETANAETFMMKNIR